MMSYQWLDNWWWPYVFIAVGGWLATDFWRWLGVIVGARLKDDSPVLIWVRAVATALVAAVIAKMVLYPSGELKNVPVALQVIAMALGFGAFLALRQRVWVGIVVALGVLIGGQLLLG